MFKRLARISIKLQLIGAMVTLSELLLVAIIIIVQISLNNMHKAILENTQADLIETAKQIALTLDNSIEANAISDPATMQAIIDRNIGARKSTESDNLIVEIRVHAPDPTSSNGYRAIAASSPDLVGQESDPEDIQAIKDDVLVVEPVEEEGIQLLDVTVPLHVDGKALATAGIKVSMTQAYAIEEALISKATTNLWRLTLIIAVVALVISNALAIFVAGQIVLPLQKVIQKTHQMVESDLTHLSKEMSALTQGDLTRSITITTQPLEITANRETDKLVQAFNLMVVHLQNIGRSFNIMIDSLNRITVQISENSSNLGSASTQLADAADASGQASTQISTTIQTVAKGISRQAESITRTADSLEQISTAIKGVSKGSQDQVAAVEQASQASKQIDGASREVSTIAQALAKNASESMESMRTGAKTVKDTLHGMQNIKTKVGLSTEKVQEMGQRSSQIGAIVETINDIASQTNLLALNAAIEAARAGEQGKGFAVVADEVRKLAEKSAIATKEIAGLIQSIQKTVGEAIQAMSASSEEVENGVSLANQSGVALDTILKSAETSQNFGAAITSAAQKTQELSAMLAGLMQKASSIVEKTDADTRSISSGVVDITQTIEEIAKVGEESSAAVEEVSASSEEMSAQAEELSASAQMLADMAQSLRTVVGKFTLKKTDHS